MTQGGFVKQLFVVCAVLGVFGVTEARAQDRGGVRVGLNLANLSGNDVSDLGDTDMRSGLVVGLFGVVPLNENIAFQPEVLFSQQGAKLEDGSDDATIKLDYLQVPLLARFRLGMSPSAPVHALFGPSFGFRTNAEVDVNGETIDDNDEFEDQTESFDIGLVAGIGVNAGPAVVDARYMWGLRNIDKTGDGSEVKNRVFSISVGFRF
jgi:hypothetical protein